MDKRNILDVAGRFISGISEVKHNVFKGVLNVTNKLAGVYYFDLNNHGLKDFESYQENLLAEEFYKYPGNLQWNYYLFMINDQLDPKKKDSIERNDKYARKYVLTENEFKDFFNVETSDASIRPNIVGEWKQRLDEVGLQDVYSTVTYVDLIAQFKEKDVAPIKKLKEGHAPTDIDKISFINKLILRDDYRHYPLAREFNFGKVNLFRGINGVGKTSLFEAIEAMVCGKCLRNPTIVMPQGCLEAEFNDSGKLTAFDGKTNKLYQNRDLNWYATNSRGNTLYNSFNRFNFFNADAAHSFSIATTEKDAREALFSIVLGPEYHYISGRCTGTLDRIRPELNKMKEEMDTAKLKELHTDGIIKGYKEPLRLSHIRNSIKSIYNNFRFKVSTEEDGLPLIEERNNQLRAILANLLAADNTVLTLLAYDKAYSEFEKKRVELNQKELELRLHSENLTKLNAEEKTLNNRYEFLSRCSAYVQDEKLMKLNDLQAKEGAANLLKSRIKFVKEVISDIEWSEEAINMNSEKISTEINLLKGKISKDETEMAVILNSLQKIESLIQQIKSHGKQFLTLDHDSSTCPLCQASYTRNELVERISTETAEESAGPVKRFDDLRLRIELQKTNLQSKERVLQEQGKIVQAYEAAFPGETSSTLGAALMKVREFIGEENSVTEQWNLLVEVKNYAKRLGFSEKEFKELKFACEQEFKDDSIFSYGKIATFQKLLNETAIHTNICKNEITETIASRSRIGNEIKRLLGVEGTSLYAKDIRDIFMKEEAAIIKLKSAFDSIQQVIEIEGNLLVTELYDSTVNLQNNILSLREEEKVQFEYENAVKENSEARKFIVANSEKLQRYQRAVETLRTLTGDEASTHVIAFFNDNFQEIIDIFKAIHVPQEFKMLQYTEDKLELIAENGEVRTISQISTGQRSALALSIFLSLNGKLTNGPDIIMFDDPVAFIDDLNALSFLDYLRLHTLRSGKQIFFATANMRLAGLFEKKFGFLETEFKKFEFTRNQY